MDNPVDNTVEPAILEGRYQVGQVIARGGMSTVYRGVDLRLGRPVAIKVMDPAHTSDPAFLARFEREARLASAVRHPGVVQVFDQGRDEDTVFLVMELIEGGTLRDLLRQQGALPVEVVVQILVPLLDALGAAHQAGLVHRDVKPENVLISDRGEIKVADFGLVRAVSSATMATGDVILGTVAYLSPEQVETGDSDARSDVYAAGIVAWEMLTGRPPYGGDNAITVAYQHVHGDVPPATDLSPGVPVELDDLILAATRRSPDARPNDATAFLHALRGVAATLQLPQVPIPVPRRRAATGPDPTHPVAGPGGTRMVPAAAPMQTMVGTPTDDVAAVVAAGPRREVEPAPRIRRPPSRTRRLLVLIVVLVLLAAAAAVGGWWLGSGRWATVPAWAGQDQITAQNAVRDAGLIPVLVTAPHDSVPNGQVSGSDPGPGGRELRGGTVTLTVSTGRPTVPVITPGVTVEQAQQTLTLAGLKGTMGGSRYDDQVPSGAVVTTDPSPGESVAVGGTVELVTSRGPHPATVPEVAGKKPEDAENALLAQNLVVGAPTEQFGGQVPDGTVLGTEPPAGSPLRRGDSVSLVLAKSVQVPTVYGKTPADATRELQAAGLRVSRTVEAFDADIDGGLVSRTAPVAGYRVDPKDPAVILTVSTAVTVPDVSGLTAGDAEEELHAHGLRAEFTGWFGGYGIVVSQLPEASTRVAPNSVIQLSTLF